MAKATATPSDVRVWANLPTDVRGRLPQGLAEEFTKTTGRKVVAVRPHSTISVRTKTGNKSVVRKIATAEARALLGDPAGKRGRFSASDMATLGDKLAK